MSQDETEYAGEETSEAQISRAEAIAARILARDEADFSEERDRVDALPGTIDIASLGLTGSSHEDWQDRRSVGRSAHLAASTELLGHSRGRVPAGQTGTGSGRRPSH